MEDATIKSLVSTAATILFILTLYFHPTMACNEDVCASRVSKCMLTKACGCTIDKASCACCKNCTICLEYLYEQCCSCVGLCPPPKITDELLSSLSTVEEISDPIPELFEALTEGEDPLLRWSSETFPAYEVLPRTHHPNRGDGVYLFQESTDSPFPGQPGNTHGYLFENCTVMYMSQCTALDKCKESCKAFGASKYRWFHDGCCECVGSKCLEYGKKESKCLACPEPDEMDLPVNGADYPSTDEVYDAVEAFEPDYDTGVETQDAESPTQAGAAKEEDGAQGTWVQGGGMREAWVETGEKGDYVYYEYVDPDWDDEEHVSPATNLEPEAAEAASVETAGSASGENAAGLSQTVAATEGPLEGSGRTEDERSTGGEKGVVGWGSDYVVEDNSLLV